MHTCIHYIKFGKCLAVLSPLTLVTVTIPEQSIRVSSSEVMAFGDHSDPLPQKLSGAPMTMTLHGHQFENFVFKPRQLCSAGFIALLICVCMCVCVCVCVCVSVKKISQKTI